MKLSSPRTWLIVAAGALLLAGGIVLYVIKNPPLPPGWTEYDCERFRVAFPPGQGDPSPSDATLEYFRRLGQYTAVHSPTCGGVIHIVGVDASYSAGKEDEYLDARVAEATGGIPHFVITSCERIRCRDYSGRVLKVTNRFKEDEPSQYKEFLVFANGWFYKMTIDLAPCGITESDADLVFSTFRPK